MIVVGDESHFSPVYRDENRINKNGIQFLNHLNNHSKSHGESILIQCKIWLSSNIIMIFPLIFKKKFLFSIQIRTHAESNLLTSTAGAKQIPASLLAVKIVSIFLQNRKQTIEMIQQH